MDKQRYNGDATKIFDNHDTRDPTSMAYNFNRKHGCSKFSLSNKKKTQILSETS